jgi:hypothetical protein
MGTFLTHKSRVKDAENHGCKNIKSTSAPPLTSHTQSFKIVIIAKNTAMSGDSTDMMP